MKCDSKMTGKRSRERKQKVRSKFVEKMNEMKKKGGMKAPIAEPEDE